MKVILLTDVARLGNQGEVVEVRDGFARNYLIPRKLAVKADEASLRQLENIRKEIAQRQAKLSRRLMSLSEQLGMVTLKTQLRMGSEGAYGAITNADIAALLHEAGHKIDKHAIILEEPIKAPGVYDIPIKLGPEVTATVKLWVTEAPVG